MGKCKCPPAGAPEWVLTYGDLMSLLLCFFILLAALSELKDDSVWRATANEIQKSFGLHGGGGPIATSEEKTMSLMIKIERIFQQQKKSRKEGQVEDPAIVGREPRVTQSRKDMRRGLGSVTFEPGSAQLTPVAKDRLRPVIALIKGYTNKIELQGHASTSELGAETSYSDLWQLSFARAKAVMDLMVLEYGIEPERIRLIANADKEPVKKREYDTRATEPNRRVAIEISDQLVEEVSRPTPD
ncbi:MAG: OmpA family protein [Phycisphaeraceae bacterium]